MKTIRLPRWYAFVNVFTSDAAKIALYLSVCTFDFSARIVNSSMEPSRAKTLNTMNTRNLALPTISLLLLLSYNLLTNHFLIVFR